MTNALYWNWLGALMTEAATLKSLDQPDAVNGPYVGMLLTGPGFYNFSQSHQYYSDLGTNVIGTQQITSPTITIGPAGFGGATFSGANVTFINVTGGPIGALVVYRHNSGGNTTWRLVCYFDTNIGLPVSPNGGNVIVQWSSSGILSI